MIDQKPDYYYYLKIIHGNNSGKQYKLPRGEITLGTDPSNTICFHEFEQDIEAHHAVIIVDIAGAAIENRSNHSGTFCNGRKIKQRLVQNGDIIELGKKGPQLKFIISTSPSSGTFIALDAARIAAANSSLMQSYILKDSTNFYKTIRPRNQLDADKRKSDALLAPIDAYTKKINKKNTESLDAVLHYKSEKRKKGNRQNPLDTKAGIRQKNSIGLDDIILYEINDNGNNAETNNKKTYPSLQPKKPDKQASPPRIYDQDTFNTMRKQLLWGAAGIIGIMGILLAYFINQNIKYKRLLQQALYLEQQLDEYEEDMEIAFNEDEPLKKVTVMYQQLQQKQKQLDSIKNILDVKDYRRFYTDSVELFIDEIMKEFNERNYHIPPQMSRSVKKYIEKFTKNARRGTIDVMNRKKMYFSVMKRIFLQHNVPQQLLYVSIQESLLKPDAVSHAGAVGMWQFMSYTGKRFGLKIDSEIDERLDWHKSTIAAAKYFKKLISLFGEGKGILLAIAAYNAGERKIEQALASVENPIRDRDFWYLYRTSTLLANETREYVPQILAWMIIDKHPETFGFHNAW